MSVTTESLGPLCSGEFGRGARAGAYVDERFLIDTGADRTVFSAILLARLGPVGHLAAGHVLAGVGGTQAGVIVQAEVEFDHDSGTASIGGHYAAFTDAAATDLSILGRDVLDLFDVIVSRRRGEILLLAAPYQYRVEIP